MIILYDNFRTKTKYILLHCNTTFTNKYKSRLTWMARTYPRSWSVWSVENPDILTSKLPGARSWMVAGLRKQPDVRWLHWTRKSLDPEEPRFRSYFRSLPMTFLNRTRTFYCFTVIFNLCYLTFVILSLLSNPCYLIFVI